MMVSSYTDAFWASLVEMMGNPDWAKSEACRSAGSRRRNLAMIKPKVKEWMMQHTIEEIKTISKRPPCDLCPHSIGERSG